MGTTTSSDATQEQYSYCRQLLAFVILSMALTFALMAGTLFVLFVRQTAAGGVEHLWLLWLAFPLLVAALTLCVTAALLPRPPHGPVA